MAKKKRPPKPAQPPSPSIRDRIRELRRVRASELLPNERNWRTHSQAQQASLRGVLTEIGYADALIAREREDGVLVLIDGHLRKDTTPDQIVPVLVIDVTEDEASKLLATLDPLAAMAGADQDRLDALLREVQTGDQALATMLTELAQQHGIVPGGGALPEPGAGGDEFDTAAALEGECRVKAGELWLIDGGKHRLLCGDSTDAATVERLMGGEKAALIVTSPPYNQHIDGFKPSGMHKDGGWVAKVAQLAYQDSLPEEEYQEQQRLLLSVWHEHVFDGGSVFYNHKNRYRNKQVVSPLQWLPGPFRLRQEIVWSRPGSVTQNARMFLPSDERIYWLYKGDDFFFDDSTEHKSWSTVWEIALETNKDHAVAFPLELPTRPIRACAKPNELIGDPFLGSGTTLIAAHRLGRRCFGCELEPKYAEIILRRAEAEGLSTERAS